MRDLPPDYHDLFADGVQGSQNNLFSAMDNSEPPVPGYYEQASQNDSGPEAILCRAPNAVETELTNATNHAYETESNN